MVPVAVAVFPAGRGAGGARIFRDVTSARWLAATLARSWIRSGWRRFGDWIIECGMKTRLGSRRSLRFLTAEYHFIFPEAADVCAVWVSEEVQSAVPQGHHQ